MKVNTQQFVISRFLNVQSVIDRTGRDARIRNRSFSSFLVTLRGEIRFTANGKTTLLNPERSVFLPEGLSYRNECVSEAETLLFNFHLLQPFGEIVSLPALPQSETRAVFERLRKNPGTGQGDLQTAMSELYALAADFFSRMTVTPKYMLAEKAAEFFRLHYFESGSLCSRAAEVLGVSETLLRRRFAARYDTLPSEFVSTLRLDAARRYLQEGRSVGETALLVGYADVWQFSRAFRRRFGFPPSEV